MDWRVTIRNDDVTPVAVVVHLLKTYAELDPDEAAEAAQETHEHGKADVGGYPDLESAERVAAALQRRGVHAMVEEDS